MVNAITKLTGKTTAGFYDASIQISKYIDKQTTKYKEVVDVLNFADHIMIEYPTYNELFDTTGQSGERREITLREFTLIKGTGKLNNEIVKSVFTTYQKGSFNDGGVGGRPSIEFNKITISASTGLSVGADKEVKTAFTPTEMLNGEVVYNPALFQHIMDRKAFIANDEQISVSVNEFLTDDEARITDRITFKNRDVEGNFYCLEKKYTANGKTVLSGRGTINATFFLGQNDTGNITDGEGNEIIL
jgi:hypothetical protein